jgi:valyl-tRNA synthetase
LTGGTPGNDLKLSVSRVEANRNFANKIWNAARFVAMKLQDSALEIDYTDPNSPAYRLPEQSALGLANRWILSRYEGYAVRFSG